MTQGASEEREERISQIEWAFWSLFISARTIIWQISIMIEGFIFCAHEQGVLVANVQNEIMNSIVSGIRWLYASRWLNYRFAFRRHSDFAGGDSTALFLLDFSFFFLTFFCLRFVYYFSRLTNKLKTQIKNFSNEIHNDFV